MKNSTKQAVVEKIEKVVNDYQDNVIACGYDPIQAKIVSGDLFSLFLSLLEEAIPEKTGGGLRLDNYKEGYKSGFDEAISQLQATVERLREEKE